MSVKMRMPKLTESLSAPLQTDTKPYLLKPVPIGNREKLKLTGGTVAVNQQIQNGDFASTSGWTETRATLTVSNNVGVVTTSTDGDNHVNQVFTDRVPTGHKVLYMLSAKTDVIPSGITRVLVAIFFSGSASANYRLETTDTAWHSYSGIKNIDAPTGTNPRYVMLRLMCEKASLTNSYKNVNVIDLTQMFGSTIADYAYTLETGAAGAGIAWLRSFGFLGKDYYPYDAGSLLSVKTSGHVTTGKNMCAPDLQNGQIGSNGGYSSNTARVTNAVQEVSAYLSNTYLREGTYTLSIGDLTQCTVLSKDASGNILDNFANAWHNLPYTFTLTKAGYVLFTGRKDSDTLNPSNYKAQIELGSTATTYVSYVSHSYPLSDIELRGIPKLVSGAIEYDGDSYEADGTVTRRYGVKTFDGSENWVSVTIAGRVRLMGALTDNKQVSANNVVANIVSNSYRAVTANDTYTGVDGISLQANSGDIYIFDSKYPTAADFKTALASKPLTVVYELATPTTETADAYENPQIVETGGTESFIDGRTVEMPVGNISEYCEAVKSVSIGMRMGKGLSVKMRMGGEL